MWHEEHDNARQAAAGMMLPWLPANQAWAHDPEEIARLLPPADAVGRERQGSQWRDAREAEFDRTLPSHRWVDSPRP